MTDVSTPAAPRPLPLAAPAGPRPWGWLAAATTAAAGFLHVLAAVDHRGTGDLVVGFFLLTALGQLAAAGGLAVVAVAGGRPGARLLIGLLAVTVALIVLYLVAHTTDLLAGLSAGDGPTGSGAVDAAHADGHQQAETTTTGPVALGAAPPGHGEPPGLLGTATVTVELLSVLAVTALLPSRRRRPAGNVLLTLGATTWLLWLAGVLG